MKLSFIVIALFALVILLVSLSACRSIPKGAKPVSPFEQKKYLGKWYEIARLDNRFERGLINVTAEYSLRNDGKIRVDNRGFDPEKLKWKQSIGKAKPMKNTGAAQLKVSFFGPFYAPYNVIALDPEYRYAMVTGYNRKYLWILSRFPEIPGNVREEYLRQAAELGFSTSSLVWVKHSKEFQQ